MNYKSNDDSVGNDTLSLPAKSLIHLKINNINRQIKVAPWTALLDLLRERLDLTGTKKGGDHGQGEACTVLVDGKRIGWCLTLAVMKDGLSKSNCENAPAH